MRGEIDAVLGPDAVVRDLEQANRLERVTAVSNEAMRLKPVAPLNFLEANVDTVVGDIEVGKGAGVLVLARIPATNEKHFADPMRFHPGRWLAPEGAHDPSAYQPFGSGPRICPGRSLALIEMRVMLATLYRHFEVERVGASDDVEEQFSFTVMPTNFKVRLKARAASPQA